MVSLLQFPCPRSVNRIVRRSSREAQYVHVGREDRREKAERERDRAREGGNIDTERRGRLQKGEGLEEIEKVIRYSLNRDTAWLRASKGALVGITYNTGGTLSPIAILQRKAFDAASLKNYRDAIALLQEAVNQTNDTRVKGWLKQQLAEYTHFINPVDAQVILKSAVSENRYVVHPVEGIEYHKLYTSNLNQARRCAEYLTKTFRDPNHLIVYINSLLDKLVFIPGTASTFEQAIKELGLLIGFNGQRPEAEYNKGPDVLWETGQLNYLVIECKNGAVTDTISKKDCDQLSGSINWFGEKYDTTCTVLPIMIHPVNIVDKRASAHADMKVINSVKLQEIKNAIKDFSLAFSSESGFSEPKVAELLRNYFLTSDRLIDKYTVPYRPQ